MSKRLTMTIKQRSQADCLIWLLIAGCLLVSALHEWVGLPWGLRYVLDVAWVLLFVLMGLRRMRQNKHGANMLALWVLLFCVYTALVYLVQFQSVPYYLWGLRNNFRFFVAFFAFATYLKPKDIRGYFKLFDILFWVNILVSLYQFFALELRGDYLGGFFGTAKGANAYTNIYFVIIATKDILLYLDKKEKLGACVVKCVAMLLVAALAELKFFFAEFILIVALSTLVTKFTWRTCFILAGGVAGVTVFAALLVTLFPEFEGFLSLEWLTEAGTSDQGYTSSGDLNRLNAISKINELWLKTGWQRVFGLGLGNCDTATFAFLNTPFFESYGDMHYSWISYAFMYLECGWIGLIFYFGFFVLVYLSIRRIEKRSGGIAKTYCRMGRILALMCMVIAIYNSSLRTEAGYMMYFALSIPFVMQKQKVAA